MTTPLIIDVQNITKRYGKFAAVDSVTFGVAAGEVVGFVGLNGAGKSTTINALLGFIRPTTGTVKLFEHVVVPQNAHISHHDIGFAGGDMSLFGNLTGTQYFAFVAGRYGLTDMSRLDQLNDMFDPDLGKKISELSRGNKQKIALIAAFMTSPKLVILDEPSSGLDPLMQQVFIDLIRRERDRGTTIFMSSHYLNEVIDVCSRILLIRQGILIKDMPASELLRGSGKMVRVVSKYDITPPVDAELVTRVDHPEGFEVSFVYKSSAAKLQQWLGGIPQLVDMSVADHTVESAFDDLYALETTGADHA
jgi:ABC-2 type transport system ATP-binding protein